MNLERKVKHALEILEKFKDWNHKYVFFSGGKDSLVALDLAYKCWGDNFEIIYVEVTGNTHPKCNKYAHKIGSEYGVSFIHLKNEREDFFDRLEKWGYPSIMWTHGNRWCLKHFKNKPILNYTKRRGVGVSGISPHNSTRRKLLKLQAIMSNALGWTPVSVLPLYDFTKKDVWDYIKQNELEVNPLYEEIGYSGNCMICPGMNKREFLAVMRRCPEFFCKWKKVHEKLRQDYFEGKLRGMKRVFHRFNKWYELYCKNQTLEVFA